MVQLNAWPGGRIFTLKSPLFGANLKLNAWGLPQWEGRVEIAALGID